MGQKPAAFLRAAQWRLAGLALAVGWTSAGCSGAHEPSQQAERPVHRPVPPILNVPALLGQSIDGLQQRLGSGTPVAAAGEEEASAHLDPGIADSLRTFRAGRLLLLACYDVHSRRVHDLLLVGRYEDSLMHQAALHANATTYLVLPVFRTSRPGSLLGLRVIDTSRD